MRSPVFRRPGCRRHAGTTQRRPKYATPEVVAGCHCTTQPCCTQDNTHRSTAEAQPRTTSGVRLCTGAIWHAPHVASPTRGEIRGFARRQPPPGWRNARLRSSSRCVGRCAASAEGHNVACLIVTTLHLRSCAGVGELPPKTACQRYAPSPTIPPRHYTHRRIHDA